MSIWYVRGVSGSDANNGGSFALAKKTLAAALAVAAAGDMVLCGQSMFEKDVGTTLNGIKIYQNPADSQAILRGDTVVAGVWTDTTDGAYTTPVAEVNGLTAVLANYEASTDANGRKFGHLTHAASAAACKLTDNSWYHDEAANLLYVRISQTAGANSNPAGYTVSYCDVLGKTLLTIAGSVAPEINGLWFWLNPRLADAGDSYLFYFESCTSPVARNYHCQDGGKHNEDINDCLGMPVLESGVSGGCGPGSTTMVFGSVTALRPIYGRVNNCTFYGHYYLGRDGAEIGVSVGMIIAYQHPSSGGPVTDVQYSGCNFVGITGFGKPQSINYDGGVDVAAGNRRTASAYCVQVIGGSTIGPNIEVHSYMSLAFTRHKFLGIQGRQGGASGGGIVLDGSGTDSAYLLMIACAVVGDNTQGNNADEGSIIWSNDGFDGHSIILINTTVIDTSVQSPGAVRCLILQYGGTSSEARRCAFAFKTAHANNHLLEYDDNTGGGTTTLDWKDNLYLNIAKYSDDASRDTAAEWFATVDTTGTVARSVLSGTPFRDWATGELDPAHLAFRLRAINTEYEPLMGVNGATYGKMYGAYQPARSKRADRASRADRAIRV